MVATSIIRIYMCFKGMKCVCVPHRWTCLFTYVLMMLTKLTPNRLLVVSGVVLKSIVNPPTLFPTILEVEHGPFKD